MVRLAGIPHVQQHVEVLLFRSSFEGEAMHVSPLLFRKILHPVIATPCIHQPVLELYCQLPVNMLRFVYTCHLVQESAVSCTLCLAWILHAARTVMESLVMYCSGGGAVTADCGSL